MKQIITILSVLFAIKPLLAQLKKGHYFLNLVLPHIALTNGQYAVYALTNSGLTINASLHNTTVSKKLVGPIITREGGKSLNVFQGYLRGKSTVER